MSIAVLQPQCDISHHVSFPSLGSPGNLHACCYVALLAPDQPLQISYSYRFPSICKASSRFLLFIPRVCVKCEAETDPSTLSHTENCDWVVVLRHLKLYLLKARLYREDWSTSFTHHCNHVLLMTTNGLLQVTSTPLVNVLSPWESKKQCTF